MNTSPFWAALEGIPGQAAVAGDWRHWLGSDFEALRDAFLQRTPNGAATVPCPIRCGCRHEVIVERDHIIGVCRCEAWNCDDLVLTPEDVTVWELSWTRLRRALSTCLDLAPAHGALNVPATLQVGSWSCEAVPVLLAIHVDDGAFRAAVAEMVARLRRPFVLLAPTCAHLDAAVQELLWNAQAAALALESITRFDGLRLHAARAPGELFAKFTPQPGDEPDASAARQAFALVQKLEAHGRQKPPTLQDVFRLYCIEQLACGRIARRFGCSKATIISRLNDLKQRLGADPARFRRLSSHLAAIEQSASDSRARRIDRRKMIDEEQDYET